MVAVAGSASPDPSGPADYRFRNRILSHLFARRYPSRVYGRRFREARATLPDLRQDCRPPDGLATHQPSGRRGLPRLVSRRQTDRLHPSRGQGRTLCHLSPRRTRAKNCDDSVDVLTQLEPGRNIPGRRGPGARWYGGPPTQHPADSRGGRHGQNRPGVREGQMVHRSRLSSHAADARLFGLRRLDHPPSVPDPDGRPQ